MEYLDERDLNVYITARRCRPRAAEESGFSS
jgi:hypothetical protein